MFRLRLFQAKETHCIEERKVFPALLACCIKRAVKTKEMKEDSGWRQKKRGLPSPGRRQQRRRAASRPSLSMSRQIRSGVRARRSRRGLLCPSFSRTPGRNSARRHVLLGLPHSTSTWSPPLDAEGPQVFVYYIQEISRPAGGGGSPARPKAERPPEQHAPRHRSSISRCDRRHLEQQAHIARCRLQYNG